MATAWQPDQLWVQETAVCAGILRGAPALLVLGSELLPNRASRFRSVRIPALPPLTKFVGGDGLCTDGGCQEQLWQQPTVWWGSRRDEEGSPGKGSWEVGLWVKPESGDEKVVSLDMHMGRGASPCESFSGGETGSGRGEESEVGDKWSSVRSPVLAVPGKCVGGDGVSDDGRRLKQQEQEQMWEQFFLDPSMWWDRRGGKKSSRSPDFRRKGSGEVLWLNSMFKPAWVDEKLVSLDFRMGGHGVSPSKASSPGDWGGGRRAGSEMGVVTAVNVMAFCQQGRLVEAVGALECLAHTDFSVSQSLFYTVLKLCTAKKDLVMGRRVHDLTVKVGYESDAYLGNHILRMYACGGSLQEAMGVFSRVAKPTAFMWSSIISAYAKHGKPKEAIQLYHEMRRSGVKADAHVFVAALQACAFAFDLESGREVHSDVLHSGIPANLFVANCLVDMYAKCGKLEDARQVFDSMASKDVVTWNALIAGYAQQGLGHETLLVYGQMEQEGPLLANHVTFASLLKACASVGALQKGRELHSQIVERGLLDDVVLGNCLVDMYAKCGELDNARQVFDSMATRDVVTCNALIAGYAQQGLGHEALVVYEQMEQEGLLLADDVTFACLLKACAGTGALQKGRELHSQIVKRGWVDDVVLGNCLVDMYAKCGELGEAHQVFDSLATKDVVTWTALIAGYAQQGLGHEALVLYGQMEQEGLLSANHVTFACLLKACASTGALQKGRQLHSLIARRGLLDNVVVGTCLVDMYAKCGELEDARQVFDSLATKNVVTWNALIAGYAQQGYGQEALVVYAQMEEAGLILADGVTFACLLKACGIAGALQKGRQLHSLIVERGLLDDGMVGTCLVDMYAKCGELEDARQVFDSLGTKNLVTWTSLIAGYVQQGLGLEALVVYGQMQEAGLILADEVTFACLLKACASTRALQEGRQLHLQIVDRGLLDDVVVGTCLVDMYAKCGELEDARQVFDSLATKNVVTWNALIAGYAQQGLSLEALVVYGEMEESGLILADDVTFACILKACGSSGALQKGRQLHSEIVERGLLDNVVLGTCVVDMYAKCGELEKARQVFDSMNTKNVVTWTALISGYGTCDEGRKALACFEEMLVVGIQPHEATFTCLLAACSHEGLVSEGRKHFDSMAEQHGIKPTLEHHNCMIDLLGRAGHLDEAEKMLLSCEDQRNVVGLTTLLNACKSHGDIERAVWCFERIVRLDPHRASAYVLMANAYADAGRWSDVDRIETQRILAGAHKKPAVATIEVNKQVERFLVGERREDIASKAESTNARLKQEGGHVPHTKLVLKPLGEKEKEDALCGHAEKLALAYGLLNTPSGTPLVVTKNLRMCSDCHSSTEIMSRLERRDIVVRDGYRVHRFAAGCCSCKGRP